MKMSTNESNRNESNSNELGRVLETPAVAGSLDTDQLTSLLSVQAEQRAQEKIDRDNEKILDAAVLQMESELEDRIEVAKEAHATEQKAWEALHKAYNKAEEEYVSDRNEAESTAFAPL